MTICIDHDSNGNITATCPKGRRFAKQKAHVILLGYAVANSLLLETLRASVSDADTEPCYCQKCVKVALTADELKRLMRVHKVSIVELSQRMSITMKHIRLRRETGVQSSACARDWVQHITGIDPGAKECY